MRLAVKDGVVSCKVLTLTFWCFNNMIKYKPTPPF